MKGLIVITIITATTAIAMFACGLLNYNNDFGAGSPPPILFFSIGLIASAEASFTYNKNNKAKIESNQTPQTNLKEIIQEATKPYIEENKKLTQKLNQAEQYFRDLKAAKALAPDMPRGNQQTEAKQP